MAAKIIANLLVAGGAVVFRAATQAYKQAIINGSKAGMTAESVKAASRLGSKQMSLEEARMILNIEPSAEWEDIMKRYQRMYEANEKNGSFYLQSKVFRARERLEQDLRAQGKHVPDDMTTSQPNQQQDQQQQQEQR